MTENQKEKLKKIVGDFSKVFFNEDMKKYTSLKVGGPAEALVKVNDAELLEKVLDFSKEEEIPITLIGNGSNILVLDGGIKGITLKIDIQKLEIQKQIVRVGAGNKLIQVAYEMMKNDLSGMEELSGIPGTIGGAIYMNAGANGKEMKDIVTRIRCLDRNGKQKEITTKEADFGYRHSIFSESKDIILEVEMQLTKGDKNKIEEKMKEYAQKRKSSQPIEYPSAGSTFKRGEDFITAKLIDDCGLKGYSIGGAQVSTKHAGFIINKGEATAQDILLLVEYIKEKVYEKFKKKIQLEMQIVGEEK